MTPATIEFRYMLSQTLQIQDNSNKSAIISGNKYDINKNTIHTNLFQQAK